MRNLRLGIVIGGVLLPYVARIPGALTRGYSWLGSYLPEGLDDLALTQGLNALVWGPLLAFSFFVRKGSVLVPSIACGFGFLAYAHSSLTPSDLTSDPQNPIALVLIPIYAHFIVLATFGLSVLVFGFGSRQPSVVDRGLKRDRPVAPTDGRTCPSCAAQLNFGASHCKGCGQPLDWKKQPRSY